MEAKVSAQHTDVILLDEPIACLDMAYHPDGLILVKTINRERGVTAAMALFAT